MDATQTGNVNLQRVSSPGAAAVPSGTATSLGTTSTGHPALSADAVPVTESSMARQSSGSQVQKRAARR